MPPGGLLVYAPSTSTNDFWNGYEPVMMWNRPAGYFDGFAAASNAPWSAIVLTRSACIVPSFFAASSAVMWESRANESAWVVFERASIHLTGCAVRTGAPIASTYPGYTGTLPPEDGRA